MDHVLQGGARGWKKGSGGAHRKVEGRVEASGGVSQRSTAGPLTAWREGVRDQAGDIGQYQLSFCHSLVELPPPFPFPFPLPAHFPFPLPVAATMGV